MARPQLTRRARIRSLRSPRRERGFSLIVSLIMLIVIIVLGISASQMSINEERGARSNRDRQVAFQAAEAALKDAEYEILNVASPLCAVPGQHGQGRASSQVCFNEASGVYFAPAEVVTTAGGTATYGSCSSSPAYAIGLCGYYSAAPAYLNPNVNFLLDAQGSGNGRTVAYGAFTGQVFASSAAYPPRYIIEIVPKNVAFDSCTDPTSGTGCKSMFRITAMGFGANANSQVVLQTIVSTGS